MVKVMKKNVSKNAACAAIIAVLGSSLSACTPSAGDHPSGWTAFETVQSAHYNPSMPDSSSMPHPWMGKQPYVKYAHNAAVPPLRGIRSGLKHQLGESRSFRPKTYAPTLLSLSQRARVPLSSAAPQAWASPRADNDGTLLYAQAPYGGATYHAPSYDAPTYDAPSYNGGPYNRAPEAGLAYDPAAYYDRAPHYDPSAYEAAPYGSTNNSLIFEQEYTAQPNYEAHPNYAAQPPAPAHYSDTPRNDYQAAPQPVYVETGTSINRSMDKALTQSPRLAIEDIRIQEAEEGLVQAKAQGRFRLNLDGTLGASQNETDFSVINRTDSAFRLPRAASLDLSLPLYQGGRIKAQKNVAKVGIDAARADYDAVETAVTQETAIAHLNVLRDRRLVEVYTRNVSLLQEQARVTRAMVSAGESTLTDEALLDARLGLVSVRLKQAVANLAASESNYKKLTGQAAPSLMDVGEIALPSSLAQVKEAAAQNNALLTAGRTRAELAEQNIGIAKSFGRPKLSLQGVLRAAEGQSDTIRRNSAAEVLLNFSVPILSGGENRSRVRQAALAQSRAMLETRELQNNLNERIEQLWAQVEAAQQSIAPNLAQKAAGQKAYDAINMQRQAGVATLLDVLSVEQTLLDAEVNLVQSQNAEQTARMELLGLMGAL